MEKIQKVREWAAFNSKDFLLNNMPKSLYNAYFKKGYLEMKDVIELVALGHGWIAFAFADMVKK